MIVVYGKEVRVSFHKLLAESKSDLRKQLISAVCRDIGKKN